jgi:hypothetical protein
MNSRAGFLLIVVLAGFAFVAGYLVGNASHARTRAAGTGAVAAGAAVGAPAPPSPARPTAAAKASPADPAAPKIVFDETQYNFGKVEQGPTVERIYTFTNRGGSTLIINRVSTSCGCTAALPSSPEIPPGGKGQVTAQFNSKGYTGGVRLEVYVDTNDPASPRVTLAMEGEVQVYIDRYPPAVYFGRFDPDGEISKTITLTPNRRRGDVHFRVTKIVSADSRVRAGEVRPVKGKPGAYAFDVIAGPLLPIGSFDAMITIFTDHPVQRTIELHVYGAAVMGQPQSQ